MRSLRTSARLSVAILCLAAITVILLIYSNYSAQNTVEGGSVVTIVGSHVGSSAVETPVGSIAATIAASPNGYTASPLTETLDSRTAPPASPRTPPPPVFKPTADNRMHIVLYTEGRSGSSFLPRKQFSSFAITSCSYHFVTILVCGTLLFLQFMQFMFAFIVLMFFCMFVLMFFLHVCPHVCLHCPYPQVRQHMAELLLLETPGCVLLF